MEINRKDDLPIIGILGDGQLSMMMSETYKQLGGQTFVFAQSTDGPASFTANQVFVGDPSSLTDLEAFYKLVDVVTLENEFLDSTLLGQAALNTNTSVLPDPGRFGLIEDKLSEKRFFRELGIKVADFFEVKSEDDLVDARGYLKLAKGGYDGVGTYFVENRESAKETYKTIKSSGQVLFESAVDFKKELSLIAVSNKKEVVFYPMVETGQEQGTCRYVTFPAGISEGIEREACAQVLKVMKRLDTCGLFAFEFFLCDDDQLILNESAPRPHNSGHITLDLTDCSQFENHMRAVAGLPLMNPKLLKDSMTMVNLLGTRNHRFDAAELTQNISDPESSLTLYRKSDSRVKRKMGHLNLWGLNQKQRAENIILNLEV